MSLCEGLVVLLVDGLSGSNPQEIQSVEPEFIKYTGSD